MKYSKKELIACLDREISKRNYVYGNLIKARKMSQEKADTEIAMMQEIKRIVEATNDLVRGDVVLSGDINILENNRAEKYPQCLLIQFSTATELNKAIENKTLLLIVPEEVQDEKN